MNIVSLFQKTLSKSDNSFKFYGKMILPLLILSMFVFSSNAGYSQGALAPRIDDIKFIDIATNNVAYLDAFKVDTEFKVRVIGKNLTNLRLVATRPLSNNITVVRPIDAPARASQKEFVVKFSAAGTQHFKVADFANRENNRNKPMLDYQREFHNDNLPTCQIYNKPTIQVQNHTIKGVYDRPAEKVQCNSLNTLSGAYTVADDKFCLNNIQNPTLDAPLQEKQVNVAPITFQIKNDSYAPIFTPFKIKIKNGINTIKEITVNRMIAQEVKTITFTRDQQKKIFARHRDCPKCYEKLEAPFNWLDIPLTIVIDEENVTGASRFGAQIRASLNP